MHLPIIDCSILDLHIFAHIRTGSLPVSDSVHAGCQLPLHAHSMPVVLLLNGELADMETKDMFDAIWLSCKLEASLNMIRHL